MNPSIMDREITFQRAKIKDKQRPYLIDLIEDQKRKAFATGIVFGFCVSAIGLFLGFFIGRL